MARAKRPRPKLDPEEAALDKAIRRVVNVLTGQKVVIEGDIVFGVKTHRRRYPKAALVDSADLANLEAARLRWLRGKARHPEQNP